MKEPGESVVVVGCESAAVRKWDRGGDGESAQGVEKVWWYWC